MDIPLSSIKDIGSLVAGFGTFFTGLAALYKAWRQYNSRKEQHVNTRSHLETILWSLGSLLILSSLGIFVARAAGMTKDQELVDNAWKAYKLKDYKSAIDSCNELVDEFKGAADQEQITLEQRKAAQTPKGTLSEPEKKAVFERGLLNGVGTCYFIIGRSAEFQARSDVARDAYNRAIKYTYARTWDSSGQGFFWAPAEASQARLTGLK